MKKTFLAVTILVVSISTYAQPNKIESTGNVGIGTLSPQVNLHVFSASSTAFVLQDNFSVMRFITSNGINYIQSGVNLDFSNADLRFTSVNAGTNWMTIKGSTGNVGIGTINPDATLAVNGKIHAKEIVVDLSIFPDFVFRPDYRLPSLAAVKTYIDQHHHLPDMPTEQDILKDGANLGELNKLLVQKVEELTLYLIHQKEETDKQAKMQQQQINKLKNQVLKLSKQR